MIPTYPPVPTLTTEQYIDQSVAVLQQVNLWVPLTVVVVIFLAILVWTLVARSRDGG